MLLSARARGLGCWGSTLGHSQPRCHGDGELGIPDRVSSLQVYRSKMDGEATSPLPRTRSGPLPSSSGSSSSSSQLSVATLGRSPSPKV